MGSRRCMHWSGCRLLQDFDVDFVRLAFDRNAEFHVLKSSCEDCVTIGSKFDRLLPSQTRCRD